MITKLMQNDQLKAISNGPCTSALEETLQKCNVQRQAYHSNCLGNHVQKMLKVCKD